ncbi:MAG: hypothetical protein JWM33_3323 [Caulobacteraceae bacterium]|nr:hypothetical protein [Caulobacteraceae bacterium]
MKGRAVRAVALLLAVLLGAAAAPPPELQDVFSALGQIQIVSPGQMAEPDPADFYPYDAQSIGDRLWVLEGTDGPSIPSWSIGDRLEEIDLKAGSGRVIFKQGVIGIAKAGRRLYILRDDVGVNRYAVEVIDGQRRSLLPPLPDLPPDQTPIGVAASPAKVVVLSKLGSVVFQAGAWRRLEHRISLADRQWSQDSDISGWNMPADGSAYYVSHARGWPLSYSTEVGGLQRIDLKTGQVTQVLSPAGGACGGLISDGCDDVGAPIPDPRSPGCIIAAVNSAQNHRGRMVRVCGRTISLAFDPPCKTDCAKEPNRIGFVGDLAKGFAFVSGEGVTVAPPKPGRPQTFQPQTFRQMGGVMVDSNRKDLVVVTDLKQSTWPLVVGRK